jgi:hypothetical protein
VLLDDDVAEIDPDAQPDPAILGHLGLAVDHHPLPFGGAAHRVDDAGEFREQAVPVAFHGTAMVFRDLRINEFAEMRSEAFVRPFLIGPH